MAARFHAGPGPIIFEPVFSFFPLLLLILIAVRQLHDRQEDDPFTSSTLDLDHFPGELAKEKPAFAPQLGWLGIFYGFAAMGTID